jgi:hypothetical protein
MTTMTAPADRNVSRQPVPWRSLAWVTWRQHRVAVAAAAALLAGLSLVMLVNGLIARSHHFGLAACHVASCAGQSASYAGTATTIAMLLQAVPALIGVFAGAPIVARELETGTFRYAWTQQCGPLRWVIAKLVPLAVVVTVLAAAASVVTSWYVQPFISAGLVSGIRPVFFNVRGIDFAAWTLIAFAIAAFAGVLVRKTMPALAVSLAAWAGLFFATTIWLRPLYQTPLIGKAADITVRWWVVGQTQAGALARYQPSDRFWHFQLIECSWLLVVALLLGAGTVWLVRGRASSPITFGRTRSDGLPSIRPLSHDRGRGQTGSNMRDTPSGQ